MNRRILKLGLALACACPALTGCELLHHGLRGHDPDVKAVGADDPDEHNGHEAEEIKSEPPRGFFKSTRLPGAMSDEGREVEKNLGIIR